MTILATSRAPLRLSAEQDFPVAPLPVPEPSETAALAIESPSVRLFAERAGRVRPGYRLGPDEAPAVAEICRRLDGLPLGIELAASRMALLPAHTIAERLGRQLDLPGAGARDLPERQRTLEAAIGWSHDLLEPSPRVLLARLSVFRGGVRLEEAEDVCGPETELGGQVIDALSSLVDQSLVQAIPGPDGARFRMLETVQMFAARRLDERGEAATIRRRHACAYLALAEEAAPHLPGVEQRRWLERLGAEHDNLRAAIEWAIDVGDVEIAMRLGWALWRFWQLAGFVEEGRRALARILAMPGAEEPTVIRARALEATGGLQYWSADIAAADAAYRAELALARQTR